jgi:hypothetical protein
MSRNVASVGLWVDFRHVTHKEIGADFDMKTKIILIFGAALGAAFTVNTNVRADNLADAAAKASAYVNRPIAASPHALEEFPWALRGYPQPVRAAEPAQAYPTDLATAAARASAYVNRPIAANPHALEEFPWALRGYPAPIRATEPVQAYPTDLATAAARASAFVNRPIAASPHALEEFPWALRGFPAPTRSTEPPRTAIKTNSQNANRPANPLEREAK